MPGGWLDGTYCGSPAIPQGVWLQWNLDPLLLVGLALAAWLSRRSKPGLAAVAVLAVAFVSPLCAISAALFSARVIHHVLLIAIAAPLLALAWPARRAWSPLIVFFLFVVSLWAWHAPAAYDLALSNMGVYWIMQATMLGAAVVFWQTVLKSGESGRGLLLILAGYMQMGLLGALLTFAPEPLYAIHAIAPLAWGLDPLADQQLAGLLMWVPAGLPFGVIGAWLAVGQWRILKGEVA